MVCHSTRLGSCYLLDSTAPGSWNSLVSTRLMLFARFDPARVIRSTRLDSAYYQSSLLLSEIAFASSKCDDRYRFRFIKMRRSIWISLLHHNATIDLDFATSNFDDRVYQSSLSLIYQCSLSLVYHYNDHKNGTDLPLYASPK
jgi:hypothetical protein